MVLAQNGLADEYDQVRGRDNDGVLDRMMLSLAAITLFLHVLVCRTGDLPFRPVMKKHRLITVHGKFCRSFRKLLVGFRRDKPMCFKRYAEDFRQAMHEDVAVLLVHPETGCMVFLQRVVLQINWDEEQAVGYAGKRAVLVNGRAAFPATAFPRHFILGQIVLMRILKIREKRTKLFMANPRQGTEAFAVVFISLYFMPQRYAYARYITNLNYINSIIKM